MGRRYRFEGRIGNPKRVWSHRQLVGGRPGYRTPSIETIRKQQRKADRRRDQEEQAAKFGTTPKDRKKDGNGAQEDSAQPNLLVRAFRFVFGGSKRQGDEQASANAKT